MNSIGYYLTDEELELYKDKNLVSSLYTEHFYNHMWVVSPCQSILPNQIGLLQFNSVLILFIKVRNRSQRVRAQSHKTTSISDANSKFHVAVYISDKLAINWSSHDFLTSFHNLLEWLTELKGAFPYIYKCVTE